MGLSSLPAYTGLGAGARAAVSFAESTGQPVSPEYLRKLESMRVTENVEGQMVAIDTSLPASQQIPASAQPVPLPTFSRYNQSIDTKNTFYNNTQPIDQSVYSVVAAARTQLPYVQFESNVFGASTQEEFQGGLVNKSRGIQLTATPPVMESSRPGDTAIYDFVQVQRHTKYLPTTESEAKMKKDAIKSLRNMETRYGLDASTLNYPFVTGKSFSPSYPGKHDIPVVNTQGTTVGSVPKQQLTLYNKDADDSAQDPYQVATMSLTNPMHIDLDDDQATQIPISGPYAARGARNALGFSTVREPDVKMVPMVVESNYPGLDTFHPSGASQTNPQVSQTSPASESLSSPSLAPSPWNYLKQAWTASNKSPGQIIIVVFSVLLVLLVLFLIIGAFALFAKRSRGSVNKMMATADRYVQEMQYKYQEPVANVASGASSSSLWTRRYQ